MSDLNGGMERLSQKKRLQWNVNVHPETKEEIARIARTYGVSYAEIAAWGVGLVSGEFERQERLEKGELMSSKHQRESDGVISSGLLKYSSGTIRIEIIKVNTKIATELLTRNTRNRRIRKRLIDRYSRDMTKGYWPFAGDAIRFGVDGSLLDGQNRLHAIIKSGVTVECLLIWDLPVSAQRVMDTGGPRRPDDFLEWDGIPSGRAVSSACNLLQMIKEQIVQWRTLTHSEIDAMVKKHPQVVSSVRAVKHRKTLGPTQAMLIAMHHIGAHLLNDRETADRFVNVFADGIPTYDGDPAHLWREILIHRRSRNLIMNREDVLRGTIYAWNNFRKRRPIRTFNKMNVADLVIDGLNTDVI